MALGKKFRKAVVDYDEARINADGFADLKKSLGTELVGMMQTEKVKTETFFDDDDVEWKVTLVQPESVTINEDALKAVLAAHKLTNKVFKPVTVLVRDDDALADLIEQGKLTAAEVKKYSQQVSGTPSVRITKKGK